ncbi:MAG TPA: hypothetical protein VFV25_07135 [Methylibium sp.]
MKVRTARRLAALALVGIWSLFGFLFWAQAKAAQAQADTASPPAPPVPPVLRSGARMTWAAPLPQDQPRTPICVQVIRPTTLVSGRPGALVRPEHGSAVVPEGAVYEVYTGDLSDGCAD